MARQNNDDLRRDAADEVKLINYTKQIVRDMAFKTCYNILPIALTASLLLTTEDTATGVDYTLQQGNLRTPLKYSLLGSAFGGFIEAAGEYVYYQALDSNSPFRQSVGKGLSTIGNVIGVASKAANTVLGAIMSSRVKDALSFYHSEGRNGPSSLNTEYYLGIFSSVTNGVGCIADSFGTYYSSKLPVQERRGYGFHNAVVQELKEAHEQKANNIENSIERLEAELARRHRELAREQTAAQNYEAKIRIDLDDTPPASPRDSSALPSDENEARRLPYTPRATIAELPFGMSLTTLSPRNTNEVKIELSALGANNRDSNTPSPELRYVFREPAICPRAGVASSARSSSS